MSANVETYRIPTTCVECGVKGEAESGMPGVAHRAILCESCKVKLHTGRTRLTLKIMRADSETGIEEGLIRQKGFASIEIEGIDLWMGAMVPNISMFAEAAVRYSQVDRAVEAAVDSELSRALEAVMAGKSYEGKFVTVVRSGAAEVQTEELHNHTPPQVTTEQVVAEESAKRKEAKS
jgi:hypothetical protein